MKQKKCTHANLTKQTVEKQTKSSKTLRKILSFFIALFPLRVAGATPRD